MKIKVLIVEDNPLTSQYLSEIISNQEMEVTGISKNIAEAQAAMLANPPDILLVDINLKDGDDGIDFVKQVTSETKIPVIYLTASSDKETIDRAFTTKPASFLTKPYDDKDVLIAIELAFHNYSNDVLTINVPITSFIFLKNGQRFEKVLIDDVSYIQAEGSYCKFITDEKEYFLSDNLLNISTKLQNPSFLRIHRSYVVNIQNVTGLEKEYVFIGNKNIPIGRSYREEVNKILRRFS